VPAGVLVRLMNACFAICNASYFQWLDEGEGEKPLKSMVKQLFDWYVKRTLTRLVSPGWRSRRAGASYEQGFKAPHACRTGLQYAVRTLWRLIQY